MPRLFVCSVLGLAALIAACGDNGNSSTTEPSPTDTPAATANGSPTSQIASPTPEEDDEADEPEPSGEPEPLGTGEAIPFQIGSGETIEAVLLSVPGPNQNVVVLTAENPGRFREAYAEAVQPGVAVLVFHAPEEDEELLSAMQTALLLAGSREYPLLYLMTTTDNAALAEEAAAASPVTGIILVDPSADQASFFETGATEPGQVVTDIESPAALRDAILGFLGR